MRALAPPLPQATVLIASAQAVCLALAFMDTVPRPFVGLDGAAEGASASFLTLWLRRAIDRHMCIAWCMRSSSSEAGSATGR